jgi:hypothetical protein
VIPSVWNNSGFNGYSAILPEASPVGPLSAKSRNSKHDPQCPLSANFARSVEPLFYVDTLATTIRAISGFSGKLLGEGWGMRSAT